MSRCVLNERRRGEGTALSPHHLIYVVATTEYTCYHIQSIIQGLEQGRARSALSELIIKYVLFPSRGVRGQGWELLESALLRSTGV